MTSYRRPLASPHASCAAETGGAYDQGRDHDGSDESFDPDDPGPAGGSPLPRLLDAIDDLERSKRKLVDVYRDVTAWGGTANTTGYSKSEYVALVGRLPGREEWKLDLLATRLPASPVTAAYLADGQISVDQAVSILSGTKRLSGDLLAEVEAAAAHAALDRNRRGDDPDVDADVDLLVQKTRTAADQDRLERDRLERNQVRVQPDLWGAGRITEDWADPEGFQTRLAAIEHAAGPPSPDTPRGTQLAEGSLATARAWLAGADAHPLADTADSAGTADDTTGTAEGDGTPEPADRAGTTGRHCTPEPADRAGTPDLAGTTGTVGGAALAATSPLDPDLPDLADLPGLHSLWNLPTAPDGINLGPSKARPTIVVRVDIKDLDGLDPDNPDTLRWLGTGSDAAMARIAGAGRLSSTPWLGRQLLDTLACNADLLVSVVDGERPLAEFRRTRGLPDRIRRQVLWRDMGCRWPGCKAPVAHCDVHHLDGDPTNHDVDNVLGLCRRHHRRLHSAFWHWRFDGKTGRFDLLRSPDGDPVHTTWPNGTPPTVAQPPGVAAPR